MAKYYRRIWEDTSYSVTTDNDSVAYTISVDGTAVYTGRAYKRPGEIKIAIHFRPVVKDWLEQTSPVTLITGDANILQAPKAFRTATLAVDGEDTGNTWHLLYDWSYSKVPALSNGVEFYLGQPVNGHRTATMTCLCSALMDESLWTLWNYASDTSQLSELYPTLVSCGNAVLHYLNRQCGWCSFLFEGLVKRTDTLAARTIDIGEVSSLTDFAARRYGVATTRKWACTTGYLTDDEAERFALDIVPTTWAYLELERGVPIPVVVTDATAEHKTYTSEGRKLVQYTLNLEASQQEERQ